MTARELVANLAGNELITRKRYDVTCAKMNTNILNFLNVLYNSKAKVIPFQFSFSQKILSNKFVILTKQLEQDCIYFAIKMFLEAISTRLQSLKKFHRRKLEKLGQRVVNPLNRY